MFKHGFPPEWSTLKKLIWFVGSGIAGASYIWKTLTGTLIHLTDALASPMQKCEVSLEPIQDLHGYDSPWPGGGSKNKFPVDFTDTTMRGSAIKNVGDGSVTVTGVPSASFDFVIGIFDLKAGSYILSGCPANGGINKYRLQVTDYPIERSLGQDNGSGVSFTLSEDTTCTLRVQVYTGAPASLTYYPMVRDASVSDATFAPYSNICPITGWTGCEVTRTGENLFDKDNATVFYGYLDNGKAIYASGQRVVSIPCEPNTTYTISKILEATTTSNRFYSGWSENPIASNVAVNDINGISSGTKGTKVSKTITTGATAAYIAIWVSQSEYYTDAISTLQIEVGSTATDYEPYSGTTLSVTFPDSAGTVYGGTVDLVSGELVVDRGFKVYDGSSDENWNFETTARGNKNAYINVPDAKANQYRTSKILCNASPINQNNYAVNKTAYISGAKNFNYTWLDYLGISSASAFKEWLVSNNLQLSYELATPITYQLTPQQIATLKGENNVWSNGDSIELTYKAQA